MDSMENLKDLESQIRYNDLLEVVNNHKKNLKSKIIIFVTISFALFFVLFNLLTMPKAIYIPYIMVFVVVELIQLQKILRLGMKISIGNEMLENMKNN